MSICKYIINKFLLSQDIAFLNVFFTRFFTTFSFSFVMYLISTTNLENTIDRIFRELVSIEQLSVDNESCSLYLDGISLLFFEVSVHSLCSSIHLNKRIIKV